MRSQVLVELPSSVKPNATPVPVIAASPAVTTGVAFGESQRHEVSLITVTSEQGRHRSAATASSDSVYGLISSSIMSSLSQVSGINSVSVKI